MSEKMFINTAVNWIKNKMILSRCSNWYKVPQRKAAIMVVNSKFAGFLYQQHTNAAQLAILIKRHEGILENILPIPSNPSYENSLTVLKTLISEAENIINQLNLHP